VFTIGQAKKYVLLGKPLAWVLHAGCQPTIKLKINRHYFNGQFPVAGTDRSSKSHFSLHYHDGSFMS